MFLCHFFQTFHEKPPCCHPHIWFKKRQYCQNYNILSSTNSNGCTFLSMFNGKIALLFIFCSKNVHSLTNTLLSYPYFVVKSCILSKTLYSHVIFFQLLHEKPPAVMPIFDQKKSILSKLHYPRTLLPKR